MLDSPIITKLEEIVGREHVLTGKVDLITCCYDPTADLRDPGPPTVFLKKQGGFVNR